MSELNGARSARRRQPLSSQALSLFVGRHWPRDASPVPVPSVLFCLTSAALPVMNPTQPTADDPASSKPMPKPAPVTPSLSRSRAIKLALWGAALLVVFAKPLWDLFRLALAEDLHSHVLLIPLISGYLIHSQRRQLPWQAPASQGLASELHFSGWQWRALRSSAVEGSSTPRGWPP